MGKTRVGQISGVVRPKGRGLIEEANGVAVRPRCQERDPELVERIGLLGNELENAAERGCRGRMIVTLAGDQPESEVRLPHRRIERDDALERASRLVEGPALRRERCASRSEERRVGKECRSRSWR